MAGILATVAALFTAAPAFAETLTWTAAVDDDWSEPGNWSPAQVPGTGDDLVLTPAVNQPMNNDLASAVELGSVTISNNANTFNMSVGGNPVALQDGGSITDDSTEGRTNAVTAGVDLNGDATIAMIGESALTLTGPVTGTGDLTLNSSVSGNNRMLLQPSSPSTYSGSTTFTGNTPITTVPNAVPSGSAVTVESGASVVAAGGDTYGSLAGAGNVTVSSPPTPTVFTLAVGGDDTTTSYSGVLSDAGNGHLALTKTGAGAMTLTGANTYTGGTTVSDGIFVGNTTSLQGDIVNDALVQFDQAADGTYAGDVSGTGDLSKAGAGKLTLSGTSTSSGDTFVNDGTLSVTGSVAGPVTVALGSTLAGTGSTGAVTALGTVAPGASTGTLSVDQLLFGLSATYAAELGTASSDRIDASGTVNLNGADLSLSLEPGYQHVGGTVHTIVESDNPVQGTFSGPTTIEVDGHRFRVDYATDPNKVLLVALTTAPGLTGAASGHIELGGQVSDTATLAGGNSPGGQVTFRLYGPGDASCSGAPVFTDTKSVSGNGDYASAAFTPTEAGTFRWTASYSGDDDNDPAATACGAAGQTVTVSSTTPPDPPDPPVDPTLEITGVELDRKRGTATLTALANVAGQLHIKKSNTVKPDGPATLGDAGTAELEVVPRNKAAKTLAKKGRLSVNPKVILDTAAGGQLLARLEFALRRE